MREIRFNELVPLSVFALILAGIAQGAESRVRVAEPNLAMRISVAKELGVKVRMREWIERKGFREREKDCSDAELITAVNRVGRHGETLSGEWSDGT